MQSDVLDDAVALVEDPEHRDALRHRRDTGLAGGGHRPVRGGRRLVLLFAPAAARRQRDPKQ
jgi:hypothetical protein